MLIAAEGRRHEEQRRREKEKGPFAARAGKRPFM